MHEKYSGVRWQTGSCCILGADLTWVRVGVEGGHHVVQAVCSPIGRSFEYDDASTAITRGEIVSRLIKVESRQQISCGQGGVK